MNRDRLLDIAREAMAGRKTHRGRERGFVFHHGRRTARLALSLHEALGRPEGLDPDGLFAAGLFHDVGKGAPAHHEAGARAARALLAGEVDAEALERIAFLIENHSHRGRPELPLDVHVLQDADLLDHFGAPMIWLLVSFAASHGRSPRATLAYYHGEVHRRHLEGSRAALNLPAALRAFDARRRLELDFLARLEAEEDGAL